MTFSQRRRAIAALKAVVTALQAAGGPGTGQASADLRRLCGALSAEAGDAIQAGEFGTPLRACFEAAVTAGATLDGMDRVRTVAQAVSDDDLSVQWIAQTAARLALAMTVRILATTTFTSRQDIEAAQVRVNAAFASAEDFAAGQFDNEVWRALTSAHAAVVRDLTARARPLPRIVPYAFGTRMPLLTLANRLFGDAGRADELLAENRDTVHPLFMPAAGRALSA